MTDKEILEKVFEQAYINGWGSKPDNYMACIVDRIKKYNTSWIDTQLIKAEIFSHNFAKAFWGEVPLCQSKGREIALEYGYNDLVRGVQPAWIIHLPHMVLEKEPLKYLEKFL